MKHKNKRNSGFPVNHPHRRPLSPVPWSGINIPLKFFLPILGFSLVYSFIVLRILGYSVGVLYQGVTAIVWIGLFALVIASPRKTLGGLLALGGLVGCIITIGAVQSAGFRHDLGLWITREFIQIQPDALILPLGMLGGISLLGFLIVVSSIPGLPLIPLGGWLLLLILGLQYESIYLLPFDIPPGLLRPGMIYPLILGSMGFWYLLIGLRRMIQLPKALHQSQQRFLSTTIAVATLLALVLPTNLPPLQLPELPQISLFYRGTVLANLTRSATRARSYSYDRQFIYYFAGDAQGNRLGGDLVQTSTVLVEVDGLSEFYLRAVAHDTYTGFSWATSQEPEPMIDFPEPPSEILPFLAQGQVTLIPRAIETRSVFTQGFPTEIRGLLFPLQIDVTHSFSQPLLIPSGSAYGITTHLITDRARLSQRIISTEPQPLPEGMDHFLQLPENFSQRVRDLSQAVAQTYDHPYEQVTALATYLRETFPYSETFPRLSADQDFVDFFLFEYQQGYCTAFASALALMARTLGIPTRYVVGFRVPPSLPERTLVQVTGFHAHTWVEAYIPGYGWLPFEPTPGFDLPDLSSTDSRLVRINLGDGLDDGLDFLQPETFALSEEVASNQPAVIHLLGYSIKVELLGQILTALSILSLVSVFVLFFLRVLLKLFFIKQTIKTLTQELAKKPTPQELSCEISLERYGHKVSKAMKVALEYLKPFGFGIQPGETITAYGKRTHRDLGFTQDFNLLELTDQLDRLMYGDPHLVESVHFESLNYQLRLFLLFSLRNYRKERSMRKKLLDTFLPGIHLRRVYQLLRNG